MGVIWVTNSENVIKSNRMGGFGNAIDCSKQGSGRERNLRCINGVGTHVSFPTDYFEEQIWPQFKTNMN